MPYIITTGNMPQTQRVRELKDALILAFNAASRINREIDEMTDAQVEAQYGVPLATVPVFRTTVDNVLTALTSPSVNDVVSKVGFSV